jgi:hypothetical protein
MEVNAVVIPIALIAVVLSEAQLQSELSDTLILQS